LLQVDSRPTRAAPGRRKRLSRKCLAESKLLKSKTWISRPSLLSLIWTAIMLRALGIVTGGLYALVCPAALAEEDDADEHNDGLRNNDGDENAVDAHEGVHGQPPG
jgi:hypothetical protein